MDSVLLAATRKGAVGTTTAMVVGGGMRKEVQTDNMLLVMRADIIGKTTDGISYNKNIAAVTQQEDTHHRRIHKK